MENNAHTATENIWLQKGWSCN